ncbi:MAG TPA: flagellar biosynthetic protein FliR [Ramlibacter sp.]|nr:flagellar biosynthetic protein FliR [Ramlibacter sp.]
MNDIVSSLGAPWVTAVLLLSVRIGALFFMTPLLYAVPVPGAVRVLIVLALASAISLPLASTVPTPLDLGVLLAAAAGELALGATLGLGILLAFAGFSLAGRLLDVQIGFGIGQVFDPVTRSQVPILTSVFDLLALMLFFLVNGHHALLRGLAYSVERFPVGRSWSLEGAAAPVLQQVAGLFTLGFALASPVVMCLLLVEFALGVVSRNLPQVNMLALGIPVKIVVGLLALALLAGTLGEASARLYASIFKTWTAIFERIPMPQGGQR